MELPDYVPCNFIIWGPTPAQINLFVCFRDYCLFLPLDVSSLGTGRLCALLTDTLEYTQP